MTSPRASALLIKNPYNNSGTFSQWKYMIIEHVTINWAPPQPQPPPQQKLEEEKEIAETG